MQIEVDKVIEMLAGLQRYEVTYHEAHCGCCSGEYDRYVSDYGDYVLSKDVGNVIDQLTKLKETP